MAILILIAAALAGQTIAGDQVPFQERCPKLTAAARKDIEKAEKDRSVFFGLTWYAREECVTLAEATRRMGIQLRDASNPDSTTSVQTRLQQNEAATFAGMWIEHQPAHRVVVAFTRGGAETLARYTRDPVFVALNRGGPNLVELKAARERFARELHRLGARPSVSSVDERAGRVEISVLGDLTAFSAAVARGEVRLPPFVHLQLPRPLGHAAPPLPADWQKTVHAFPRAKFRDGGPTPDILRTGTLLLESGCLRLKGERRNPVIVWPNEAALDLTQPDKVRVLNRSSGKPVEVGKRIDLGGNAGELADTQDLIGAHPACPGPYFVMGNFAPYDEAEIERTEVRGRAGAIRQYRQVGSQEALHLAQAEAQREKRFRALAASLLKDAPDSYAGMYPYQGRATFKFARDPQAELRKWVPADLRAYAKAERVPQPLAALSAERNAFLDDVDRLGIKAHASEDIENGRLVISSDDLQALGRAASEGKVRIPASARLMSSGAMPEGGYSEAKNHALETALKAVPDWAEMLALVEGTKVPGYLVTYKKNEPDRAPTAGQSLEITRFLVALGFTAEDLRALHAEGQFPARAYIEQNGRASAANRALLAQEAVVAEVIDVTAELLGDGFRSTVKLKILEGLKGELGLGEIVKLRLVSGLDSDGKLHQASDEPVVVPGLPGSLLPGSRWFVLLSERAGASAPLGEAPQSSPHRLYRIVYGAWPIVDDTVASTYHEHALGSLAHVRRQLAPVDAAFDRARMRTGKPLMRRIVGVK